MKICIDPGHGGRKAGAEYFDLQEKTLNMIMAMKVKKALDSFGHVVYLTRDLDEHISLAARAKMANYYECDVFVSLHHNAAEDSRAHGFEVWTSPGQTKADTLATLIVGAFAMLLPDVKVRADYHDGDPDQERKFTVLMKTAMPAVLVEFGFMSNISDRNRITDKDHQDSMAMAVAIAIDNFKSEVEDDI